MPPDSMDLTTWSHLRAAPLFPLLAETTWAEGLAPVVVCVVAVLASSFFAAMAEAAFLALSTTKAKAMEESDLPMERLAGRLRLDFAKPLAAMVVLNNAHIAGSTMAGYYAKNYFAGHGVGPDIDTAMGVFTAVLTLVVIIWGEIVPKTIGENHSVVIAKYAAYPVWILKGVLTPVLWLMHFAQRPFQRVGPHPTTEEEIAQLASIGQEQGAIEEHEGDMIHRVLKLNDITAEQIMTPRPEMVGLSANQTLDQAAEQIGQINRSLIPLYGKNRDEVVVILDRMDALLALAMDKGKMRLTDTTISFKPFYVPKSMPADELLVKFQRRTEHMAIVVGEYGDTVGLVTLEDVLEEIVGEIYDEEDIGTGNGIQKVAEDELLCDAAAEIKDVNDALSMAAPNHRSVAGLLLDEMERIPRKGDEHVAHGMTFRIEEANERAILKVRVKRVAPPVEAVAEDEEASE
jgi:CBS domain containing-hemolysin-like protein